MSFIEELDRLLVAHAIRGLGSVRLDSSSDPKCLNDGAIAQALADEWGADTGPAAAETCNDGAIAQALADGGGADTRPASAETCDDETIAQVMNADAAGARDLAADGAASALGAGRLQCCPVCSNYVDLGSDPGCGQFVHFSLNGTPWDPHDVENAARLRREGRGYGCAAALVLEGGVLRKAR